jgi:hypothetical protein
MARPRVSFGSMSPAFTFVLTMGVVNLFGDITYEGGGSINGSFMASLGASAAVVSITAGVGEFLGYALRPVAGYAADKTGRYWLITFIGYAINLIAVPAMAIAGNWPMAAAFVLAERIGRAIRKPTVEAMLSYTTRELGTGWVYGLNTARRDRRHNRSSRDSRGSPNEGQLPARLRALADTGFVGFRFARSCPHPVPRSCKA